MARTAILERIFGRVTSPVKRTGTWSVLRVERMLDSLGIRNYEFNYETRVVRMTSQADLTRILFHLMPSEISCDPGFGIIKLDGSQRIRIGSWQFEAKN